MIVVVGSINLDLVVRVARLPGEGETVRALRYAEHAGGKGANQAVAARRAGATVTMIGRVGADEAGSRLRDGLARAGVVVDGVRDVAEPTGRALIEVDEAGANRIVVVSGANAAWRPDEPEAARVTSARLLVMQREIPDEVVARTLNIARSASVPVLLNAAPADGFDPSRLGPDDRLVVNAHEAALLLGDGAMPTRDAPAAARKLAERGPGDVVVTLGPEGAVACGRSGTVRVPGHAVDAVDTTGAGDAFVGALAAAWAEGLPWPDALRFATAAGAEAVRTEGAQPSLPERHAILARLEAARHGRDATC